MGFPSRVGMVCLVLCIGVLAGCTGGGSTGLGSGGASTITLHQERLFEVGVPLEWVQIERQEVADLQRHYVLGYARPEYVDGFATNMTVVTEDLVHIQDSMRYAEANMLAASRDILDYQALDRRAITVPDGEGVQETMIHVFEGRYSRTDPLTKYIQMYLVKERKGYVMTVNIPYAEADYGKYIDALFATFRFY